MNDRGSHGPFREAAPIEPTPTPELRWRGTGRRELRIRSGEIERPGDVHRRLEWAAWLVGTLTCVALVAQLASDWRTGLMATVFVLALAVPLAVARVILGHRARSQPFLDYVATPGFNTGWFGDWHDLGGRHHLLRHEGLFVDGEHVVCPPDGYDSLAVEIQQHPSTGERLWLVLGCVRPSLRVLWQDLLPPGDEGVRVAGRLLDDPRGRDETPAKDVQARAIALGRTPGGARG